MSHILLSALWRASLAGGIALLIVGALCLLLPRLPASWRCNLWRLAFLKTLAALFVVGSVTVPILPHTAPPVPATHELVAVTAPSVSQVPLSPEVVPPTFEPVPTAEALVISDSRSAPSVWKSVLVALYLSGVLIGLARILWAGLAVRGLVRRAQVIEHPALAELSMRLKLRNTPRLARSGEVPSPILVQGTILLPQEPDDSDHLLIAHELAHLRRGDLIWEWIGVLTQTIFWFHPLVWLARREERLAREEAADALALLAAAAPHADYARALLEASLKRSGATPLLGVGVFEKGSRLRRRLEAIAQPRLPRRKLLLFRGLAAVVAGIAFIPWRAVARQRPALPSKPATSSIVDPPLPLRGVMSGLVLDPSGKPVSGAEISWVVPRSPKPAIIAKTTTDARGEFVFHKAPGIGSTTDTKALEKLWRKHLYGWVMVKAQGLGLGLQRIRFERRTTTIRLTPPQTYTAEFRDNRGKPIQGLSVWARALENGRSFFPLEWLGYAGKTDARGQFQAVGMPQNDKIWFEFDQSRWRKLRQEESENETRLAFRLDTGHTLEGFLRFPDGRPVTRVLLMANYTNVSVYSNAQGYFKLQGLPPGTTTVQAHFYGAKDFVAPANIVVSIPESQELVRHDITLVPAARIVGRVTNGQGNPMKSLTIRSGGNIAFTREDGSYELSVPEGKASVLVENLHSQTVQTTRQKPTTLDFQLSRITTITGEVRDSRGEPVIGAFVDIGTDRGIYTDSQGRFRWQSLDNNVGKTGKVGVFVYQGAEGAYAEVAPGEDNKLTLQLSEKKVGHLVGRVTDTAGKPLRNTEISVAHKGRSTFLIQKNQLDSQGNFRIPVPPGAHCRIHFNTKGYGLRSLPKVFFSAKSWTSIALNRAETKDLGQIVMVGGDATFTGKLLAPTGKPLTQASVTLFSGGCYWSRPADAAGQFAIRSVVKGASGTLMVFSNEGMWLRKNVVIGDLGTIQLNDKDRTTSPPDL